MRKLYIVILALSIAFIPFRLSANNEKLVKCVSDLMSINNDSLIVVTMNLNGSVLEKVLQNVENKDVEEAMSVMSKFYLFTTSSSKNLEDTINSAISDLVQSKDIKEYLSIKEKSGNVVKIFTNDGCIAPKNEFIIMLARNELIDYCMLMVFAKDNFAKDVNFTSAF